MTTKVNHPPAESPEGLENAELTRPFWALSAVHYGILAAPLGALYGYLSLEAFSGMAPAVLVEIAGVALLARRLPGHILGPCSASLGFCCGFAIVWLALLAGRPYCCGAGLDAAWAAALAAGALLPALAVWRAAVICRR